MEKVIDFPNKVNDIKERRKKAIMSLPQFRGEVPSKNTIRSLPNVQVGQIFWVDLDDQAFVVSAIEGKKCTIRPLDENATVSTGITIFEMNKNIVSKEPEFDFTDTEASEALTQNILKWFNQDCPPNTYYLLYGRDIHYVTLFKTPDGEATPLSAIELLRTIAEVGHLISMDFNTETGASCIEIWVRTDKSKAELLYLMPYDAGLVELP